MGRGGRVAGARILRSAPWSPLLSSSAAAAVLLCIAALAHRNPLALPATLLGLSSCGGAAAYILDEEAGAVSDATPTSWRRRVAWRTPILAVPATVALVGLATLNRLDPTTHWLRLIPVAAGALAIGISFAALLRTTSTAPGDLAGPITLGCLVLVVTTDPFRRWVTALPLAGTAHPGRSYALWLTVIVAGVALTLACTRDPGRRGASWAVSRAGRASSVVDHAQEQRSRRRTRSTGGR